MSEKDIIIRDDLVIPWNEVEVTHSRSGGPGGQNVNKVNSKVQLKWVLSNNEEISEDTRARINNTCASYMTKSGDILIYSTKHRSQRQNLEECIQNLSTLLEESCKVAKKRKKKTVSKNQKAKRLQQKKVQGEKKKLRSKVSINY